MGKGLYRRRITAPSPFLLVTERLHKEVGPFVMKPIPVFGVLSRYYHCVCLSFSSLPILFPSLPEGGTKSRVETQIRLTVDLAHASSSSAEPFRYDKVGSWKWLRLPKGTTTKKRTRKEGKVGQWNQTCSSLLA